MSRLLKSSALALALSLCAVSAMAADAPATGRLGSTLGGLKVAREDITKALKENTAPRFVDSIDLYTLRSKNELQGTLELAHFKAGTPWTTDTFQRAIAEQMGSAVPLVVRLSGRPVYVSSSRGVILAAWFKSGYMVILTIRRSYDHPKTLIRAALEVSL